METIVNNRLGEQIVILLLQLFGNNTSPIIKEFRYSLKIYSILRVREYYSFLFITSVSSFTADTLSTVLTFFNQ